MLVLIHVFNLSPTKYFAEIVEILLLTSAYTTWDLVVIFDVSCIFFHECGSSCAFDESLWTWFVRHFVCFFFFESSFWCNTILLRCAASGRLCGFWSLRILFDDLIHHCSLCLLLLFQFLICGVVGLTEILHLTLALPVGTRPHSLLVRQPYWRGVIFLDLAVSLVSWNICARFGLRLVSKRPHPLLIIAYIHFLAFTIARLHV